MATLNSCRQEMRSIIREMRSIRDGIRTSFSGIGQEHCADCLDKVIGKYEYVLRKLENVDTNFIADFINGEEA